MNVLIVHCHPREDGRIKRHIQYLLSKGINAFVIHFDIYSTDYSQDMVYSSHYGEKGIKINYCWGPTNKKLSKYAGFFILFRYYRFFGKQIMEDTINALEVMGFDKTKESIIHVHDPMLLPLAKNMVTTELNKSKIIYDRHEVYEKLKLFKYFGSSGYRLFEEYGKKYVAGIVSVSDFHNESINRFFPLSRIETVPNYPMVENYSLGIVKHKIESFRENNSINFVYIGSLANSYDRDVNLLLKIADSLLSRNYNATFFVGGNNCDQDTENKLKNMEEKYGSNFKYLGYVSREKTIEITQHAHIGFFLIKPNSSYWVKSSPNKVFEYLISGTIPIIRADIDQVEALSKCSLIFKRSDSSEKIIDSINNLVENPSKVEAFMKEAFNTSSKFTWEAVAHRYINLYRQVLFCQIV